MDLRAGTRTLRMLDSLHMKALKFARSLENSRANHVCLSRMFLPSGFKGSFAFGLLLLSCSVAVWAQQDMQSGSCSDPANASDPQCQGSVQSSSDDALRPMATPNATAVQPRVPGLYVDNERFSSPQNGQQGYPGSPNGPGFAAQLPAQPLTEFQKFVASSTGEILPVYGADLFRSVPSTFAPVQMAPVPPNFLIGPDDELRIRVWGQVSFEANVRVDRSGDIYLPHVGPVHVAGLKFSQLDEHLRSAVGRVYRNFDLTADMGQIRSIQVYVTGQARRPGVYTVSSLSTLVDALFASGGPSVHGSLRHIELHRGGAVVTDFDLYDLITRGDKSKDVTLMPEDVIYIPPVGPQVAVTGSVRVQAIYELKGKETLSDLFADTGGVTAVASSARISIERIEDHRDRHAMEVAFDKAGLATPLADGDVVHVLSIIPSYEKTVTLRGNIANPGRFAWHAGMRVSDLIPDKDSLITRNYWWRRAQQGFPAPEFEPMTNWADLRQPSQPVQLPSASTSQFGTSGAPQAPLSQEPAYAQQQAMQGSTGGGVTQAGQQMQRSTTGNGALAEQQGTHYTGLRAMGQQNQISILAPEIDWDYAAVERLDSTTLKTKIIPFDLGKLVLDHDEAQDVELKPGDVVTIFSEADIKLPLAQQTKIVKLEGEFAHAGSYTVKPGETLRELVERAGGFTSAAYLYGSEFTRESTRRIQQARIDDYVQSVEMQMQRGNMALVASGAGGQGQATTQAAQASEQQLMARLQQVRATGRIVLEFKPGSRGVATVPDIALEDGDTFVVPSIPSSVNVVGAVYNQNSFLYSRTRKVGDYLHMAGGPTRSADAKRAFIIRADGEVVSRAGGNGPWGNSFTSLRLNPGDSIVVPDKTIKPSALTGVMQWSGLFSQFALGAAALSVLP